MSREISREYALEPSPLEALTHLPMYEVPDSMAADIDEFVARFIRAEPAAA